MPMTPALSTVCLHELPWQEAFGQASAANYKYVELLMIPNWVHVQPGQVSAAELLEGARDSGLTIMGLHAGAIDGASDQALSESVNYIERVIDEAVKLGIDLVVFTGMPTPQGPQADSRPVVLGRIVQGLQSLMRRLSHDKVHVGLENHYRCQIETLEDYHTIFSQLGEAGPWIGATVDTGHFTSSGIDPAAVVEDLGRRTIHVHIKDHIAAQSVALGHGTTDNKAVVAALRKIGYDSWLTVELEVQDRQNAIRYVQESFGYMQRLLA